MSPMCWFITYFGKLLNAFICQWIVLLCCFHNPFRRLLPQNQIPSAYKEQIFFIGNTYLTVTHMWYMHRTSQLGLSCEVKRERETPRWYRVRPLFGVTRVEEEGMLSQGIVFWCTGIYGFVVHTLFLKPLSNPEGWVCLAIMVLHSSASHKLSNK